MKIDRILQLYGKEKIVTRGQRIGTTTGDDGITSEILLRALKAFPKFVTAIYNGCLEQGAFSKAVEGSFSKS